MFRAFSSKVDQGQRILVKSPYFTGTSKSRRETKPTTEDVVITEKKKRLGSAVHLPSQYATASCQHGRGGAPGFRKAGQNALFLVGAGRKASQKKSMA